MTKLELKTEDEAKEEEVREKEAAVKLLAECETDIAKHTIKERFWQRERLKGGAASEQLLGQIQSSLAELNKLRDFLKETYSL
jgi:hypothetical protein